MRRPLVALLTLALVPPAVQAEAARDPLAGDPADPIALARMAEEAGDARLLAELTRAAPRARLLVAVRASRHAAAPEALVPALAALACGRDPQLAPEAAYVLGALGARLTGADFFAREVLRDDLARARESLRCVERAPLPRADIVAQLGLLAAALEPLLR